MQKSEPLKQCLLLSGVWGVPLLIILLNALPVELRGETFLSYEEQIRTLETAVQKDPANGSARQQLVELLFRETRYNRALVHMEKARGQLQFDTSLKIYHAHINVLYGRKPLALTELDALRPKVEGDAALLLRVGEVFAIAQERDAAKECLEAAEALAPGNPQALILLARMALLNGDDEEARILFDRIPLVARGSAGALQIEAGLQIRGGEREAAVETLRAALLLTDDPAWVEAVQELASLLINQHREEEARILFVSLTRSERRLPRETGHLGLAQLFMSKGLYDRAIAEAGRRVGRTSRAGHRIAYSSPQLVCAPGVRKSGKYGAARSRTRA